MGHQDTTGGCGEYPGRNPAFGVKPERHVGKMHIGEVDASEGVGSAVGVEERAAVGLWNGYVIVGGNDIALKESTEVCLERLGVDGRGSAGVGIL